MPKLLCTLCLSKEHNTQNCPRLQRNGPRNTIVLPVTPRVTQTPDVTPRVTESVTVSVTALEEENAFLRSEVARLVTELEALKHPTRSNAERQRAYRERHGNSV